MARFSGEVNEKEPEDRIQNTEYPTSEVRGLGKERIFSAPLKSLALNLDSPILPNWILAPEF
ncbi:hypothetical protein LC593_05895 [Nostoc sp. CHAB 5844]|nr:hypothetical protein [Nostoc sp. CHAB 5844]